MRKWKTHDLVDLMNSFKQGYFSPDIRQFTNDAIEDQFLPKVVYHDVNWPTHMDAFKIEKGVEIPRAGRGVKARAMTQQMADTLNKLVPGESFFVPIEPFDMLPLREARACFCTAKRIIKKSHPERHYMLRSYTPPETPTGVRIWRIR